MKQYDNLWITLSFAKMNNLKDLSILSEFNLNQKSSNLQTLSFKDIFLSDYLFLIFLRKI